MATIVDVSDPTATAPPLSLHPTPGPQSVDCTRPAAREDSAAHQRALPFLGRLDCDTERLIAGSHAELLLTYTVGSSGMADSGWLKLCFRYYSDWDFQTEDPTGADYVSAELDARHTDTSPTLRVRYDVKGGERPFQKTVIVDVVDGFLRPGDRILIRLGDRRFGGPGTRVQTFVEDAFAFHLFVDVLGTSRMARAARCTLSITPGPPDRLVVHGPRVIRTGTQEVRLRAHLADRWGNACRDLAAEVSARVDGAPATAANTPSTGWSSAIVTVPAPAGGGAAVDVTAQLPNGVRLSDRSHLDVIDGLPGERAYFADLHVHSDDTVGTQDTPWNLAYGREVGGLDILGYTANDFQITDAAWQKTVAHCREVSADGEFVCYPGVEWCGNAGVGGDHNVVFLGSDTTLARSLEWHADMTTDRPTPQHWPITDLYGAYEHDPEAFLLIPHVGGRRATFDRHHRELERLIEVHSTWGTSPWFLEDALARGLRLGASAASDEHRGRPGSGAPGANIFGGTGGLTGVLSPSLTAAEVGRTLRARRTWATTGARSVALLRTGTRWMGDEFTVREPTLQAEYALYGSAGWEEVRVYDARGEIWRRDFHSAAGLSGQLVRIRVGGARHRDRYRWASWHGALRVTGAEVRRVQPWALTHPEQRIEQTANGIDWHAVTYGADMGAVLSLDTIAGGRFELAGTIAEDGRPFSLEVTGEELMQRQTVELPLGGAGLHVCLERIAEPELLPLTVTDQFGVGVPVGESAVYLRARQWDGHQVWTSPLFLSRSAT